MARADANTLLAFFAFVLIGGSNFVAVRFSNAELDPFWGAAARFGAASILFFALVAWRRAPLPRGRVLAAAGVYGVLNFGVFYACVYWALVHVRSGLAAVVLGLTPLVTFLMAVAQRLETFRLRALGGGALAVVGLALVFREELDAAVPAGALVALLVATSASAQASIVVKRSPPVDPAGMNAVGMLAGALVLFALSAAAGEGQGLPTERTTWIAFAYLVTFGGLALFLLVLYVLRRWSASATAYGFVLFPIVATALGAWLADEAVTWPFMAGSALVLLGVYVGALAPKGQVLPDPTRH